MSAGNETDRLRLSVIGCGYLGAVHAAAMVELGHEVVGVETDPDRLAALRDGRTPFYEPGLDDLLARSLATGRLRFTGDAADAADAQVHFLCVGTPTPPGQHHADLSHLHRALDALLPVLRPGATVVGKSTVPVGTAAGLLPRVEAAQPSARLVWNPEFLREGLAIRDTLHPDRIVVGIEADDRGHAGLDVLRRVYARILAEDCPLVVTDLATAELAKVAANAFLATKISFVNAMADVCDASGADIVGLADVLGHDARIGRQFLNAGIGFGGGCLPKDLKAFMARSAELGADRAFSLLREVEGINLARRELVVDRCRSWLGGELPGRRVAVLGAAFKPDSDDIRESPGLAVAEALHVLGCRVTVTDPHAVANGRRISPQLSYADTVEEAVDGAELVVLVTEWREYLDLDPRKLATLVAVPRILDARNALPAEAWTDAGWSYRGLGRSR